MLHSITWGKFSQTMFVLVTGYYLVVALLYYRKELVQFLQRR